MYRDILVIRPMRGADRDAAIRGALETLGLARATIQGVECEKREGVWVVPELPADPAPSEAEMCADLESRYEERTELAD